jgi:hypothetical protein
MELATKGRIRNCDITRTDISNAEDIFGPEHGSLQGKTVRTASEQVRSGGLVPIPAAIMAHYQRVVLYIDVMKVNKMPFLVTISRAIKFGTVAWLKNAKSDTILAKITEVRNIYIKRGFILDVIEADGQFEPLRGSLSHMGVTLNKCSREEHVPVAERRIRTLKERCRCICNTLPFKKLPGMLVVQMVSTCNFWLNVFPPKDGVSRNINPRELITGMQIDYKKHIRAEFGEYVQVHEQHDNTMQTRTTGAIATKPTGNVQGGHWFFSLTTGRMIDRRQWTPLPMPADVIDRIHLLARTRPTGMHFTDMRNDVYDDDLTSGEDSDTDSDYGSDDESSTDDDDNYDDFIAGVEMNNQNPDLPDPPDYSNDADETQNNEGDDDNDKNDGEDPEIDGNEDNDVSRSGDNAADNQDDAPGQLKKLADYNGTIPPTIGSRTRRQAQETGESLLTTMPVTKKQRRQRKDLLARLLKQHEADNTKKLRNKRKNEKRRIKLKTRAENPEVVVTTVNDPEKEEVVSTTNKETENEFGDIRDNLRYKQKPGVYFPQDSSVSTDLTPDLEATAMTQYTLKKGLKEFGNDGIVALGKEMGQLHTRKVAKPVDAGNLTRDQKRASLRYLMFLTKKRCGRIKARGCADGRKQRETTSKADASAPTVAIESVMLSATIDAMEERDVATLDIPGAFMQADIDEVVHVKFEGEIAEMLVKMDPKLYRKFVKDENGKSVLYVELLKALYGTLRAALLFWKLLSTKLVQWGFVINPYDWCVANKTINGKQCTILWHVDDLKISHVDSKVNDTIIDLLETEFGKEAPLTITRGRVHDYLGMTLDYTEKGKVKIKMIDYVTKMLAELPEEMSGEAPTPAGNHLFAVDEKQTKVNEQQAQFFHTYVAKTLFLCKRSRPDLQPAVAFLCTRVKACDMDDYKKLKRMLQFLRATKDEFLTLSATSLHNVRWWIDASYAVHPDMKSHTGGALSLGTGVVYGTSKKQKLNTNSSTESEVVGTHDVMPQVLWTLYFLEAQGFKIDDNILYQDNKSSILLESNGRGSSGQRTRHMNVRYFFIADRVKSKEIRIEYCPTGIMVADYFTKPLQGAIFRKLRDMVMGNTEIPLPQDIAVPTNGIPAVSTPLESRSVLESEPVIKGSPRSHTVLPAHDKVCTLTALLTDKRAVSNGEEQTTNKRMASKPTVSWAQIARR